MSQAEDSHTFNLLNVGICSKKLKMVFIQNSVLWPRRSSRGHDRRFSKDPLPVFSAGGPCEQYLHGQGCPFFDVVHPAILLPTKASPTLEGALKDGFGEAVMACDMPKPCKCPSLSLSASQIFMTKCYDARFSNMNAKLVDSVGL